MKLHVITVGGNHPIDFWVHDPSPEQLEAMELLAEQHGHLVTVHS